MEDLVRKQREVFESTITPVKNKENPGDSPAIVTEDETE